MGWIGQCQLIIQNDYKIMLNFFAHHTLIEGDYCLKDIRVMDEIGRGNSHVYTAIIHNDLYALKQIEIKSDYEYQSFLNEITNMKKISELSQDMIKYYGYFVTMLEVNQYSKAKYAHIVMQCAEMNLQNFIACRSAEGKRFSKGEIIQIIDFLLNAFAHLQKNKIAHCDIKPENILILNHNQLAMKLCDVGSCKIVDDQSMKEVTVFGTVPFLAPEVVKTKSNKSSNVFQSDVFSFGLVVLYVITFKKFSSKERIEISEQAYYEVIMDWIKQAREIVGYDSRIAEIFRATLEFDDFKRPLFKGVKSIYDQEKKKKMLAHEAKIKKLQADENERRMKIESNFMSIPTTKINLFKTRNINTKISTRTTSIGFPKINRNYERNNQSPGQLSPGLSPLLSKRQSSCFGSPEKANSSTLDFKKIIYVNEEDKDSIPFQFLTQEEKIFVFFTNGVSIKKAECVSVYQPCSLAIIYELAEVETNKLYLEYEKFQGIGVSSDCPTLSAKKIYANFSNTELVGGYKNLFKSFCSNQLESLEIVVTGASVNFLEISDLLDRLSGKNMKYLGIIWQNNLMNPEEHSLITEKASKLSIKKLALVMNQNFIKYDKQARFLLPKNCETLYLEYKSNFMSKLISNLSISIQSNPIKQLYLNFSNNNLSKSESNILFKSLTSIETLQKLMLNLSWNPIQDISYIISSLSNLKNISSLELKLHHTGIPEEQVFYAVSQIKYLFDRNMKILKIGYDRNMGKESFEDRLDHALDGFKALKVDVIGYDNKYFMAFIKKTNKTNKSKAATNKIKGQKSNLMGFKLNEEQKQKQKPGYCQSLYTNNCSYDNYLCLTCSQFSELSKTEYFCKSCIESCKHKGHNIVKIYERVRCCCAYSGSCTADIAKRICAEDLKIKYKKKYYCYKCSRKYCQACVLRCQESHLDWVQQIKQMAIFQCRTQI